MCKKKMAKFDVIAGKIADDATNRTLVAYISGTFGKVGSKTADEFCISRLLPERLKDQYCFKTEKALYDESTKLWWNGPSYIVDMYKEELSADKSRKNRIA